MIYVCKYLNKKISSSRKNNRVKITYKWDNNPYLTQVVCNNMYFNNNIVISN